MSIYVALFRGINVGGSSRLPMKELVSALEASGVRNVRTYIQSGNALFESDEEDRARLAAVIAREISDRRGFAPQLMLLTIEDVERAIAGNPFPEAEADPSHLHLGFLAFAPPHPDLGKLDRLRIESERFRLVGAVFYLYAPEGVGRSKLAAGAEKSLGVPMTDRNWTTVCTLRDMARQLT